MARAWWKRLHKEYDLEDSGAAFLLESALRAFDRMNQAGELIGKHGIAMLDQNGKVPLYSVSPFVGALDGKTKKATRKWLFLLNIWRRERDSNPRSGV